MKKIKTFESWKNNIIDNEIGKAIDKWKYENGLTISWSQTRNLIVIITDLIRKFK